MASSREERLKRIGWRLGTLSSTHVELLPPLLVLKDFILELQLDINDEAYDLMAEGKHNVAVMYLNHGINTSGLLRRDGSSCFTTADVKLLVLRSECANKLGYSKEALQDAEDALSINGYSTAARVQQVKAKYKIASAEGSNSLTEFKRFLRTQIPETVKGDPQLQEIISNLEDPLLPMISGTTTCKTTNATPTTFSIETAAVKIPSHSGKSAKDKMGATGKSSRPEGEMDVKQIGNDAHSSLLGKEPSSLTSRPHPLSVSSPLPSAPQELPSSIADAPPLSSSAEPSKPANINTKQSPKSPVESTSNTSMELSQTSNDWITVGQSKVKSDASRTRKIETKKKIPSAKAENSPVAPASSANVEAIPSFSIPLKYVCGECLSKEGVTVGQKAGSSPLVCDGSSSHVWTQAKIVAMYSKDKQRWCKVRPRHLKLRPEVNPKVCPSGDACLRSNCMFPDTKEEVRLWVYMAKYKIKTLDDVMSAGQGASEDIKRRSSCTSSSACKPSNGHRSSAPQQRTVSASAASSVKISSFHHPMKYVCGECFAPRGGGQVVEKRASSNPGVCDGSKSHLWKTSKMIVMYSTEKGRWCKVRPRHHKLRRGIQPVLCSAGEACSNHDCMFPHTQEEIDLWVYMAKHNFKTLAEVVSTGRELSETTGSPSSAASPASQPSSVHQSSPPEDHHDSSYCSYCNQFFSESWKLQQHIKTKGHWSKVNSDTHKTDQWKYRSPPWNVVNGQYEECQEHKEERCMFSGASKNNCTRAHSPEELKEWQERHRFRMMKVKKTKEQKLYAFMDYVLEKFNFSVRGEEVIADELPGIHVKCPQELSQFLLAEGRERDSTYNYTWSFTVKISGNTSLRRICLLYDEDRIRFRLSQPRNESEAQVCPGNLIVEDDGKTYQIDVIFHSQILGRFSQWVLFDRGIEPHLVRKLQVQVGTATQYDEFDKLKAEKDTRKVEVWNSNNREIARFSGNAHEVSNDEEKLMTKYQMPMSLTIDDLDDLSRENYKEYMHRMLYIEEQECNAKISKFATNSKVECLERILLETSTGTVAHFAVHGSMFGIVDLKIALMDDSDTSQIIKRSVKKIMLKFCTSEKIYEATILAEQDEFGKQNQDVIYIKLSPTCVVEQELKNGTEYQVEIQMQLDRLPFCRMHSAVDRLQNMDMVFPPMENPRKLPLLKVKEQGLNDCHQEQAIKFISDHSGRKARGKPGVGPVLIYGPFGTGKTHTLATAVKRTLDSRPESKILICTHSNSAADLYITDHFHKLVEIGSIRKMTRVYAEVRDIKTIGEIVRRYTPIQDYKIQIPTTREIKESSVVIATLITSHRLESSELRGHFTHILIDEAGQALETEVLQPLTLATGSTCVVLAGDHLQMSPKVFSRTARHAKFHKSLLERLFYRQAGKVLLSSNYRTHQKMLDFISKTFYYGSSSTQQLKAVVNHEPHPRFKHPLVFTSVKGEDHKIGMSYVNQYEVCQTALIVKDLHDTWPEDKWGKLTENSIGVVTPYRIQVRQIRNELRKLRLGNIVVETAQNTQGKQYRVLIISAVRTRSTLNNVDMTAFVSTTSPMNRPEDTFDYGFLSDPRLLNTVCTRAQSLLVVVGNPTALCSVGECSNIWRRYLKECQDNGTLFPTGTTLAGIQQEIEGTKQQLNPYAPAFRPADSSTGQPPSTGSHEDKTSSPVFNAPSTNLQKTDVDSWLPEEPDSIIPDGILQELHRQISEDQKRLEKDTGVVPKIAEIKSKGKLKFRMVEQSDRIVLAFNYKDRPKRAGAQNPEEPDNEESLKNDMHDERVRQTAYKQVKERPDKYKVCSFHCEKSGETYAIPLDEGLSGRISITSKHRRGRALNLDEVIVEILDDMDEAEDEESKLKKYYGRVICISKRAPRAALNTNVVCKLDEHMNNLMVPVDRTLPKMYVWSQDKEKNTTSGATKASPDFSTVSIYDFRRESQEHLSFLKNVEVSRKDRKHKLFIVRYQKWFANAPYPMGVVTEELPQGEDKEKALRILKLIHGVKEEWNPDIVKEVESKFPAEWKIPEEEFKSRYDARSRVVFTIDPPECKDLDDALSVDIVDRNYQVGIHIADVSYFVSKDSLADREAKNRAMSFYPPSEEPINMLPPILSNRLCSLLPDQDRLTLSVFITFDQNGSMVHDIKFVRSVIRSCKQLTYHDAEKIIRTPEDGRNDNATVQEKILILSKLAKERRRSRLGLGRFAFSHDSEEEEFQYPLAHSLVEEMMLLANQAVAVFLVNRYPNCSPLRRQLAPSEENVKDWLYKYGNDVLNSLDLQSKPLPLEGLREVPNDMKLLKERWEQLCAVATATAEDARGQMSKIVDLVCSDENHPQLAAAKANFHCIQEVTSYISSGDHPESIKRGHHTLNIPAYTHFTSPIRRYFDLVVHRMLLAALKNQHKSDKSERPYTTAEIAAIAHHCNYQDANSKAFGKKTHALQYALRLQESPCSFKAFVIGLSDSSLELVFPYRHFLPSKCPFNLLKPINRPEINADINMEVRWRERVYELHRSSNTGRQNPNVFLKLDTEKMVINVSNTQWQEILAGVLAEDMDMIQEAVANADTELQLTKDEERRRRKRKNNATIKEITCETSVADKTLPFVSFKRNFKRGDVVEVQLHATIQMGVLMPSLQLFSLTPKLHLCTEHRADAIECFSQVAAHRPPAIIKSIQRYKAVWLPIVEMLTAYMAVISDESSTIHGVKIDWQHVQEARTQPPRYRGVFKIKQAFCHDRNLKIHHSDYLCIRYKDLPVTCGARLRLHNASTESIQSSSVDSGRTTFVAHAVISAVVDIEKWTEDWTMAVHVVVNQHSAPFPEVLLNSKKVPDCTIELIPKSSSDGRLLSAVQQLDETEQLIKDIVLHQKPKVNNRDPLIQRLLQAGEDIHSFVISRSPLATPNESQSKSLRQALRQRFTIIQGPPGTGKTITGAHLVHFFNEVNKQLPDTGKGPPQVLYCGPSNKSVDVVADYLLTLGISAVRVYNTRIEKQDFPIPGHSSGASKLGTSQEAKMDPRLRHISLHHLIRRKYNPHREKILGFDRRFKTMTNPEDKISYEELTEYKKTIRRAEAAVLPKYKVVLCTCNEAGSGRIRQYVNAVQCIVDEAGMCNEPETLIPLVASSPRQVVLIGDHKQLRPIIQEQTAVQLGMEISLLEKYEEEVSMLRTQYRMHESICAFPSEAFYKGMLVTAESVKQRRTKPLGIWPGGDDNPLVFCHHVGAEEVQSVRTEEGNEQSRANPKEVKHVIRMVSVMVNRLGVKHESLVILTQYRLQKAQLEDELQKQGLEDITVSTVITSQGREWDYVIVSTVRSLPRIEIDEKPSTAWKKRNLGFITDENQMNVAITRPRLGLIIVGNKHLLRVHDTWKRLLSHYEEKNAVVDAVDFL